MLFYVIFSKFRDKTGRECFVNKSHFILNKIICFKSLVETWPFCWLLQLVISSLTGTLDSNYFHVNWFGIKSLISSTVHFCNIHIYIYIYIYIIYTYSQTGGNHCALLIIVHCFNAIF